MQVHVHVVGLRELEHAADVSGAIAVVARRAADQARAALQARDQVRVRLRMPGEPLLGEHAELEIDGPRVVLRELLHRLEAAQARVRVHLDVGAHVGRAVHQAALQGVARARVHVLHREAGLHRRDALHVVALAALRRRAAIDDARLVEVDVGLDQAGRKKASAGLDTLGVGVDARGLHDGDAPTGDADVLHRRAGRRAGDAGFVDDEIEVHDGLPRKSG